MSSTIGQSPLRVDAYDKVTGRTKYCADLDMQGMLYCALIRSTIAHGTLLDIDPSGALAVPGVRAVITAKDIPGKLEYGAPYEDHPVLAYDRVRFIGDPIAIIVAETITALELGRQQVRVLYHELPAAFTLNQVMAVKTLPDSFRWNLLACHHLKRGKYRKGFPNGSNHRGQYRYGLAGSCIS